MYQTYVKMAICPNCGREGVHFYKEDTHQDIFWKIENGVSACKILSHIFTCYKCDCEWEEKIEIIKCINGEWIKDASNMKKGEAK